MFRYFIHNLYEWDFISPTSCKANIQRSILLSSWYADSSTTFFFNSILCWLFIVLHYTSAGENVDWKFNIKYLNLCCDRQLCWKWSQKLDGKRWQSRDWMGLREAFCLHLVWVAKAAWNRFTWFNGVLVVRSHWSMTAQSQGKSHRHTDECSSSEKSEIKLNLFFSCTADDRSLNTPPTALFPSLLSLAENVKIFTVNLKYFRLRPTAADIGGCSNSPNWCWLIAFLTASQKFCWVWETAAAVGVAFR